MDGSQNRLMAINKVWLMVTDHFQDKRYDQLIHYLNVCDCETISRSKLNVNQFKLTFIFTLQKFTLKLSFHS